MNKPTVTGIGRRIAKGKLNGMRQFIKVDAPIKNTIKRPVR